MMLLSGTTVGGIASAIVYRRQKKSLVSEAYIVVYVHKTVHRNDTNTTKFTLFLQHFRYDMCLQITNSQCFCVLYTIKGLIIDII